MKNQHQHQHIQEEALPWELEHVDWIRFQLLCFGIYEETFVSYHLMKKNTPKMAIDAVPSLLFFSRFDTASSCWWWCASSKIVGAVKKNRLLSSSNIFFPFIFRKPISPTLPYLCVVLPSLLSSLVAREWDCRRRTKNDVISSHRSS